MKTALLVTATLTFACSAGEERAIGRYQLLQTGRKGQDGEATVMRIDTSTGQTWVLHRELVSGTNYAPGVHAEAWRPVSEDFNCEMYNAVGISQGWRNAEAFEKFMWHGDTNAFTRAMDTRFRPPSERRDSTAPELPTSPEGTFTKPSRRLEPKP